MLKLRILLFASGLAVATVPAVAVDLPDYGSKNFSPAGETPSYFANEAAPVSARTADTTERDWSVVDEMAPSGPTGDGGRSAHSHRGRHGRYAVAPRSGRHGGRYAGSAHSVRVAGANRSDAAGRAQNTVRTTTAKHGRAGARHASAVAGHYSVN
jgi:hypothetical protein